MLPAKVTTSNMLTVEDFSKAVDKLIVFRNVCFLKHLLKNYLSFGYLDVFQNGLAPNQMVEHKNKYPYIIAIGSSKLEITHFFIEVEREIMNVPIEFTIGQTFGLFFKIHKIFKMNCDPNMERLFKFCEHFVYKINDCAVLNSGSNDEMSKVRKFRPTTAMMNLFDLLNKDD